MVYDTTDNQNMENINKQVSSFIYASYSMIISINVILFVGVVIGNALVLAVVYRGRALRSPTNLFVGSLAFADLLVGLFVIPTTIITYSGMSPRRNLWMCNFLPFIQFLSFFGSVYSMVLIAYERYNVIVLTTSKNYSRNKAYLMIALIWLLGCIYSSRNFIPTTKTTEYMIVPNPLDSEGVTMGFIRITLPASRCFTLGDDTKYDFYLRFVDIAVFFLIPCSLMIYLYTSITKHLIKATSLKQKGLKHKKRAILTFVLCVVFFFICFVTFQALNQVFNGINKFHRNIEANKIWININLASILFLISNSIINPFVYVIFNKDIRQVI